MSAKTMPAITLLEPWATALLGPKDIENRTWMLPDRYVGRTIAIHASKRWSKADADAYLQIAERAGVDPGIAYMMAQRVSHTLGCIIGVATFGARVTVSRSPWFFGPVGWSKVSAQAIRRPIPCRGALGIWQLPEDITEQVREQLREQLRELQNPTVPLDYKEPVRTRSEYEQMVLGTLTTDEEGGR